MEHEELKGKLLEAIESPLPIVLPRMEHRLPTNKEQLEEALVILQPLKEEYAQDQEISTFLAETEDWLKEGIELLQDENALTEILLNKFPEYATLKIDQGNFPADQKELDTWTKILEYLDTQKPSDKEFINAIADYREMLGYYDAETANQWALEEIANNVYTDEGEDGSVGPANKEEALQALILTIKPDSFEQVSEELYAQLKEQHETMKKVAESFGATEKDLDAAIDRYFDALNTNMQSNADEQVPAAYTGANEDAYTYINQLYDNLSYVDKEGIRWAASAQEVREGYEYLEKATEAIVEPNDPEIQSLITNNKAHLDEASVRRFAGAWWLIICAGLVTIFQLYSALQSFGPKIDVEQAVTYKENKITSLENRIKNDMAKEVKSKETEKAIKQNTKEVENLREMSPEKYARKYNHAKTRQGFKNLFWALIGLAWIVAYYFAAQPFGYDRYKRQVQYQRLQKATGWAAKFLSGVLGVFWSIPITTYITKYTDGTEERSNDALFVLGLQIFVTILVIGSVLFIAKAIIPLAAIIAYVRNYPGKAGAKQVHKLFKNGKSLTQNYIDKITQKQAA